MRREYWTRVAVSVDLEFDITNVVFGVMLLLVLLIHPQAPAGDDTGVHKYRDWSP